MVNEIFMQENLRQYLVNKKKSLLGALVNKKNTTWRISTQQVITDKLYLKKQPWEKMEEFTIDNTRYNRLKQPTLKISQLNIKDELVCSMY